MDQKSGFNTHFVALILGFLIVEVTIITLHEKYNLRVY